jgi:hypothetical protein
MKASILQALLASLALGLAMTLGDYAWDALALRHRAVTGVVHGALMCLFIGAFVGWRAGRPAAGAAAGTPIGVLAAGIFYLLAPGLGYSAMFPAWMSFWIGFAVLQARLDGRGRYGPALARGLAAAVLSGLAFYAISGIWTDPAARGDYLRHLWSWTVAFLPGFTALVVARPR